MRLAKHRADAFCARFSLRAPALLAPMSGASAPSRSTAIANAGGLGACGQDSSDGLPCPGHVERRMALQIEFRRLRLSQATQTPTPMHMPTIMLRMSAPSAAPATIPTASATRWSFIALPANPAISSSLPLGSTEASVQCRRRSQNVCASFNKLKRHKFQAIRLIRKTIYCNTG
jgi:hypothetical protein